MVRFRAAPESSRGSRSGFRALREVQGWFQGSVSGVLGLSQGGPRRCEGFYGGPRMVPGESPGGLRIVTAGLRGVLATGPGRSQGPGGSKGAPQDAPGSQMILQFLFVTRRKASSFCLHKVRGRDNELRLVYVYIYIYICKYLNMHMYSPPFLKVK